MSLAGTIALAYVLGFTYAWILFVLICLATYLTGFVRGTWHVTQTANQPVAHVSELNTQSDNEAEPAEILAPDRNPHYLRGLLNELGRMHNNADLYERYQCFTRIVEDGLNEVLGPATVSLWCPSPGRDELIACQIRPETVNQRTFRNWMHREHSSEEDTSIPIRQEMIRQALQTGTPQWVDPADQQIRSVIGKSRHNGFDVCIPLYRDYGQPLLVLTRRQPGASSKWNEAALRDLVELIQQFWEQLQATNQRQWQVEHDDSSGVLRDSVFLRRAQDWASQAQAHEELFTLVVTTMRGFRRMFAGEADKWRRHSGLFAGLLHEGLKQCDPGTPGFLIGRMADDVFAVMLLRKDAFLGRSLMEQLGVRLQLRLSEQSRGAALGLAAVDVQWTLADQEEFDGDIEEMLNQLYRRLFSRDAAESAAVQRLVMDPSVCGGQPV